MKNTFVLFIIGFVAMSCGQIKRVDTSGIEEQRKTNKIKHVTESQLIEKFTEIGDYAQNQFNLPDEIDCITSFELGKGRNVEFYNSDNLDSALFNDNIRGGILEAIKYSFDNNINIGTNLQEINDTLYAYSFPLSEKSFLKTSCKNDFALVLISKTQLINSL